MSKKIVYKFKVFDRKSGEYIIRHRYATREAIFRIISAEPLEDSGIEIKASDLNGSDFLSEEP